MGSALYYRGEAASQYLREKYGFGGGSTLAKLASVSSDGPPFRKAGRAALYTTDDLDAWGAG